MYKAIPIRPHLPILPKPRRHPRHLQQFLVQIVQSRPDQTAFQSTKNLVYGNDDTGLKAGSEGTVRGGGHTLAIAY